MNGLLLIDKPLDWTSFDVVNKVRRIIAEDAGVKSKSIKVGHSGTLDPRATGLLVLAIGTGTKQLQSYTKLDKTYDAIVKLGETSTTDDSEGELQTVSAVEPSGEQVHDALNTFVGTIEQRPPAFSAIKINGRRAYSLARKGKAPEMKPRPATIYSISDVVYEWPTVSFTTDVASGTYIRSIARDIGETLSTGGHLASLRRTKVGEFDLAGALKMDGLNISLIRNSVIPLEQQI